MSPTACNSQPSRRPLTSTYQHPSGHTKDTQEKPSQRSQTHSHHPLSAAAAAAAAVPSASTPHAPVHIKRGGCKPLAAHAQHFTTAGCRQHCQASSSSNSVSCLLLLAAQRALLHCRLQAHLQQAQLKLKLPQLAASMTAAPLPASQLLPRAQKALLLTASCRQPQAASAGCIHGSSATVCVAACCHEVCCCACC